MVEDAGSRPTGPALGAITWGRRPGHPQLSAALRLLALRTAFGRSQAGPRRQSMASLRQAPQPRYEMQLPTVLASTASNDG